MRPILLRLQAVWLLVKDRFQWNKRRLEDEVTIAKVFKGGCVYCLAIDGSHHNRCPLSDHIRRQRLDEGDRD